MTTTHAPDSTTATARVLYLALDLGQKNWKLAFTVGLGQKPRLRTIAARDIEALLAEIRAAKRRFGLAEDAPVVSCYEAGRDGFWLHRCLLSQAIEIHRRRLGQHRGQPPQAEVQVRPARRDQARGDARSAGTTASPRSGPWSGPVGRRTRTPASCTAS